MSEITPQDIYNTGAILEGHFVGISGEHMPKYIVKDKILRRANMVTRIARAMAHKTERFPAEVIVGPAVGGAILAHAVAHEIACRRRMDIGVAYSEKVDEIQTLKRGYDEDMRGQRVIVVDDTVNTTKSIGETVAAVRKAGGDVVLALSIINRNKTDTEISRKIKARYQSLVRIPMPSYKLEDAPPELLRIPVNTKFGRGATYLASQK
jgi:orotate phosphoribosyltransferase